MPVLFSILFSRIGGYIMAGLAVLALLLGVYRSGRKSAQVDGMEDKLENVKVSNEVENEVRLTDPDSKRDRLFDKWSRD